MTNYLLAYYQAIKDGRETVGRWILLFYEYVINGLEAGRFTFDIKKATLAITFIENFCHHSEGRSDLLKLALWQKSLISVLFGIMDQHGNRQFREVIVVIGRKNGKTLLAAAIIAYCAFLDDEHGAKIYCVAPKLDQADLVYSAFWQTIQSEPELKAKTKPRKSDYYIAESNTSVKKIAFNARKSDGFNPHLVICDEIASWPGDAGLKQYEVMRSALGARRQPMVLSISTAGYVNDGIYDELIKRATAFLLGNSKETRLAPFLYIIDNVDKWNDINELRKSNPNLGVSVSVDYMLEEIAVAEGSRSKKIEFLVKYCNIKQNSVAAWLDYQVVTQCGGDPLRLDDFRNSYCVGGIDLSQTTDLTSCCVVIEKNGKLNVFSQFFMPKNRLESAIAEDGVPYEIYRQRGLLTMSGENYVDYPDVFNWFRRLVTDYRIYPLKIGYDRYSTQYLVQDMAAYGFHMDDVYQGPNLSPVLREFEGIIKDGDIRIGDNDLLKAHLLNSALKTVDTRVQLAKVGNRTRIDGMAALIDAMTVRQKWAKEIGGRLKNK